MTNLEQRLKKAVAEMQQRDPRLAAELEQEVRPRAEAVAERAQQERPSRVEESVEFEDSDAQRRRSEFVSETIVLRTGRPVLLVKNDQPDLVFKDAESAVWRDRLLKAKEQIHAAVLAVGRVEVQHHPTFDWIGTGWLVREDVIVTNRHVAQEFGRRQGAGFTFKQGTLGRTMTPSIDFLEEFGRSANRTFAIKEVLHIEDDNGPDLALLRVEPGSAFSLARPISLSQHGPIAKQQIATIGYPARDSRIPEQKLMEDIFGDVFDKKRLAPGQVIRAGAGTVEHDCSTLGGNSGSVVLDLESGAALGLHFAGRFLVANFAVAANVVEQRLQEISRGERRTGSAGGRTRVPPPRPTPSETLQSVRQLTVTVPVRITVDIGTPADEPPAAPIPYRAQPPPPDDDEGGDDDEIIITEGRPADYADREGYTSTFLGDDFEVPLPTVNDQDNVLTFDFDGETKDLLDYEHFSVKMGRQRKMCIFSAVNIDGQSPHKSTRPGWRTDPRIPENAQLVRGPYGDPPKFSRGHMTRREDPMWGTPETAKRGNADSMHLTNAVPQMQPFNAGIWLGLEDYALQNARKDDMRICVFTGPVLRPKDPTRFGVKIPLTFWKVIAFVHDESGELCATGYTMSQKDFLEEKEFVFGAHRTAQTSLAAIENMAGVSFGSLTALDPLAGDLEEAVPSTLVSFDQIRFV